VVGGGEEPGGEVGGALEARGVAREEEEGGLGGLVGEDAVAELPKAGGVDEGGVSGDELREGVAEALELGVVHAAVGFE
jgi:hypothetical protein